MTEMAYSKGTTKSSQIGGFSHCAQCLHKPSAHDLVATNNTHTYYLKNGDIRVVQDFTRLRPLPQGNVDYISPYKYDKNNDKYNNLKFVTF